MRTLLLADHDFATRERAFLGRLEVALADEGVSVLHAAPAGVVASTPPPGLAARVAYPDRGAPLFGERRARRLRAAMEQSEGGGGEGEGYGVVHALGSGVWGLAGDLAAQVGAALLVEVFTVTQARLAGGAGFARAGRPTLLMTPDAALERIILREAPAAATRVGPWGVPRPLSRRTILPAGGAASLVLTGSGADRPAWVAALEGLAIAAADASAPAFMVFADAEAARRAGVWPLIQRLQLADRVSLVPRVESSREIVLRADALVLPEARGEHRSIVLDAMASGMAVLAAADPFVGSLIHQRTARLVAGPDARMWAEAVSAALRDPEGSRRLGESAGEYVAQHHRLGGYAAAVIDGYEWLVRREAVPARALAGPG